MRLFSALVILVTAFAMGCSKKCDPNDLSTWDASCPAGGGGGNGGGGNGGGSSGSGIPIEYHHSTAPGLPDQMRVFGQMRDARVSGYNFDGTGPRLRFQASVDHVTMDPAISYAGTQLQLGQAAGFFIATPNIPGCTFRNGFGYAGATNNEIVLEAPDSEACRNLFGQMSQTGFIVMFSDVPVNSGGKVGQVSYQIQPD